MVKINNKIKIFMLSLILVFLIGNLFAIENNSVKNGTDSLKIGTTTSVQISQEEIDKSKPTQEELNKITNAANRISSGIFSEEDSDLIKKYNVEIVYKKSEKIVNENVLKNQTINNLNLQNKVNELSLNLKILTYLVYFLLVSFIIGVIGFLYFKKDLLK